MEKIGYIDKSKLALLSGLNSSSQLNDVELKYENRDIIEQRNDVVQPICAGVMMTKDNKILVVNKKAKATGEKSPEKGKSLLYIGGHLDIADRAEANFQTFSLGMRREIEEEMGFALTNENASLKSPIVLYTPLTEKSARHLGVIFPVIIERSFDTTFTDGKCKFVDINVLSEIDNFEAWSEIILKEIVEKMQSAYSQL
ncbi:MAG: hypothetical protein J6A28_00170 [Clostridia bacterium]|nr:hypothetical protein [Clostridia bacterium]